LAHKKMYSMKKVIYYFSCLLVSTTITISASAQTETEPLEKVQPRSLSESDRTVTQRLQKDLNTRNSKTTNQPISWFDSGDGYYGTYSADNQNYMTRYDSRGAYIETMRREEWNKTAPASLKSSFDNSAYKAQEVTNYWAVLDPNRRSYYIELNNSEGRMTKVWVDDKGVFTTTPYVVKPNN
jgi:hypothetical protein